MSYYVSAGRRSVPPIEFTNTRHWLPKTMDETKDRSERPMDPSTWVQRHGDYLYRYALSRLRDGDSAEEAVQEAFVAGLRHVDQYSGSGSERSWLLGILKRKIVDLIRRRNRASNVGGDDGDELSDALFDSRGKWRTDPRSFGSEPGEALEKQEFWNAFRGCLDSLPQRQADVFALRELDGTSSEQICKELDLTPSNLWVLLYRARIRLAHCMKRRW